MISANPASTNMSPKEYCTSSGGASAVGCHPGARSFAERGVAASPSTIKSSATRNATRGESCDFESIWQRLCQSADFSAKPRSLQCHSLPRESLRFDWGVVDAALLPYFGDEFVIADGAVANHHEDGGATLHDFARGHAGEDLVEDARVE